MLRIPLLFWISSHFFSVNAFIFPDIKLEAFDPEGLKVSIPETDNVKLFAFHGNRNRPISQIEPGEFTKDIINPKVNGWFYFNPNLKLSVGDKIYYWMFIQHENLGYRKYDQVWEVKELLPLKSIEENPSCLESVSKILGYLVCKNEIIFNDTFTNNFVDELKWKRAHFIPSDPDFEFCSYQRRNDTCYVEDSLLTIKPIALTTDAEVHGVLDLRTSCSSHLESSCIIYQDAGFILPPVVSAKIKTIRNFKYGIVEIKAKLPRGNWIYPEIYLESASDRTKRIWVAYARGNDQLTGSGGDDIGGKILFGGPILNSSEPERSKHLSSYRTSMPFSSDYHVYSVLWEPTKITLYIDGLQYGSSGSNIASLFNEYMHLCMGVGVGGVTDFPDDYVTTNNTKKPWKNFERLQNKKFFNARDEWLPSWSKDSSMRIDYVKITAL